MKTITQLLASIRERTSFDGSLANTGVDPYVKGDTDTGLDQIVDLITNDLELNRRLSQSEIAEAAEAANGMNAILVEAIKATGVANDGWINAADMHEISEYIRNDEELNARWIELHGDDEGNEETGFHLVQNDGAVSQLFGQNAVNTVADGLYHIGFSIKNGRFLNEDGNRNVSLEQAADWLNDLLAEDLMAGELNNPAIDPYARGTTGTGLDRLVELIAADDGLNQRLSTSEITTGAQAADQMNAILVEAIKATGAADNGRLDLVDMRDISGYIRDHHGEEWIALHGDDENNEETGFHLVQNDGGVTRLFDQNAINTVADGIYHMGFEIRWGRYLNEDGNANARVETVMEWLNDLLTEDLAAGTLMSDPIAVDPQAIEDAEVVTLDDVTVDGRPPWGQPSGHAEVENSAALQLANGTVAFGFTADDPLGGTQTLFSKDGAGNEDGHVMAYIRNGQLTVRLQSETETRYLNIGEVTIEAGQRYDFAMSFGEDGVHLYLNGVKVNNDPQWEIDWTDNDEDLVVGASGEGRSDGNPTWTWNYFDGTIEDFSVYNRALNRAEVAEINQAGPLPGAQLGEAAVEADAPPNTDEGTGLIGEFFDHDRGFGSVAALEQHIAGVEGPTHTFTASVIDFGNHNNDNQVTGFLGDNATLDDGNGAAAMETIGARLTGYIYLEGGEHEITVRSDDGYVLKLGGEVFSSHQSHRPFYPTSKEATFEGGLYEFELLYYENWGGEGLRLEIDGETVGAERFYQSVEDFNAAMDEHGPAPIPEVVEGDGSPALTDVSLAAVYEGTGLSAEVFDLNRGMSSIPQLLEHIEAMDAPTHTFDAKVIDFGGANQRGNLEGFIGDSGELTAGNGGMGMTTVGMHLSGYVYIPEGEHRVTVRSDDGYLLQLGGEDFSSFQSQRPFYATNKVETFEGGLYEIDLYYYENWGAEGLRLELDGELLGPEHFYQSVEDFQQALAENGAMPEGGLPDLNPAPEGTTGTGLDQLVELIVDDAGLNRRIDQDEIYAGGRAADGMNAILVEAIRETGVANDGALTVGDMYDINAYIQANHYDEWVRLHGDDENNEETGFHLVQNDGGVTRLFNDNAINTVADGLYHAGFDINENNNRFLNEDGNNNQRLERVAYWLNELLSEDLGDGSLANAEVDPQVHGSTGTGLDEIIEIINNDAELHRRVSNEDIREGARAADGMNAMILEAIRETGVANNGEIGRPDIYAINAYLRATEERYDQWLEYHGDDEGNVETGYHTVQNDGATTRIYDNNALNTVADGLYHLGFEIRNGRILNEDGNANATIEQLSVWLNSLLEDELADGSLVNEDVTPYVSGSTGTGLDQLVSLIQADEGLNQRLPIQEIRDGAQAADGMNAILVEAIRETGVANDGTLTVADMYDVNAYIQANHYDAWVELHGDDENNEETGFHLVQNDGGVSRLFADNAVNTVADGIYHAGFDINANNNRFLNEDGNNNQRLERVAYWLEELLADDLADGSLANAEVDPRAHGSTGTGLDEIIEIINNDPELHRRVSNEDIREGARAADGMNAMILEAIRATGVANDGEIGRPDVYAINAYLRGTEERYEQWLEYHGDDEGNVETGYHTVQNDGAITRLYDNNALNTVADGLYHLGFEIKNGRILNEDGNANATIEQLSVWLNSVLENDLADGSLANPDVTPYVSGSTGTGLDQLVSQIQADEGLNQRLPLDEIREGAAAADGMNAILIEAIKATGVANDGSLTVGDMYDINAYIQANHYDEWVRLHGDDENNEETGFHLVQNDGGVTRLFSDNAINTVADGIYHAGFDINENNDRFLNEDGNNNQRLERVAYWLEELLSEDLADGSLANEAVDPYAHGATGTGLDQIIEIINADPELNRQVSNEDIREGARAADGMNAMILEAIRATGVANDGEIGRPDVYAINAYLRATEERYEQWLEYHGDDEGNVETGYHTVQNDGATTRIYDNNALNTVADGIYHLGFDIRNGRILNEDGNRNATIEQLSVWLNSLLENDLADGSLVNPEVTPYVAGSTGTGLDQLVSQIQADEGLNQRLPLDEIREGAAAADGMNVILVEAIKATGVANDGALTVGDLYDINAYIQANHYDEWVELHGDDENNEETGFHLVQNDGGVSRLFADNAINTVADGIYHAGFDINENNDRFLNEDGNNNQRLERVAYWLEELLVDDLADGSLANAEVDPHAHGTTGTGLDEIIEIINNDAELHRRVSNEDIREGARAADGMNAILLEAIVATGVANNGDISAADIHSINAYIREHHYDDWLEYHGDDEGNEETGYHTVQNDGAITRLYDNNALNTVADGIYHLGFEIRNGRILNEDGNANASIEQLSVWLNSLLEDELADGSLANEAVNPYVEGSTGTGLDRLVDLIVNDPELNRRLPQEEITEAAQAADGMNAILVEAIKATGAADDGQISLVDMRDISAYIRDHHAEEWIALHGDDENNEETGFHLAQNDGGVSRLFDQNAVNTVADGIYHMGFEIRGDRYLNEDGNANQRVETVMEWLNDLLTEDLASGELASDPITVDPQAIADAQVLSVDTVTVDGRPPWGQPSGHAEVENSAALQLANGTVAFGFTADTPLNGHQVLFSKDGSGRDDGGHLKVYLHNGALGVRFESDERSYYLDAGEIRIEAGQRYDVAFSFGEDGAHLYLNGEKVDNDPQWEMDWTENDEDLVIGASGEGRSDGNPTWTWNYFDGTIEDFSVYNRALNRAEVAEINQAGSLPGAQLGEVAVEAAVPPNTDEGTGLIGEFFDHDRSFGSVAALEEHIANADGPTHTFTASAIDFGDHNNDDQVTGFLGDNAELASGDGATAMHTIGARLTGYIYLEGGEHEITVRSDDGYVLKLGGEVFSSHQSQRAFHPTSKEATFEGGLYEIELLYYENGGREGLRLEIDGETVGAERFYQSVEDFNAAMDQHGPAPEDDPGQDAAPEGTTGTGLDKLVELIVTDPELERRVDQDEIYAGARAADGMNAILVEAIRQTGVANDGELTVADMHDINAYIQANHYDEWVELHGDDEGNEETGFHLVQNDGAVLRLYDSNAVNTVADGLYHAGFDIRNDRFLNEDGNNNQRLERVAYWLNELLSEDLADGSLANAQVDPQVHGTTGTGLDEVIEIINSDPELHRRVSNEDIREGARAADGMNAMILEAIQATGVANNGEIGRPDVYAINAYLRATEERYEQWLEYHGDDEGNVETGYHTVQNDGAITRLYDNNALNTVADGLYHLGFEIRNGRILNEDGNANATIEQLSVWLNSLLEDELADGSLVNPEVTPYVAGSTGTGLDQLVSQIQADEGLNQRLPLDEIRDGAEAADGMNAMIVEAIRATGVANDGALTVGDLYDINAYIQANHYDRWVELHGDDENNEETGFHLVQNDGGFSRLFADNAINTVADGIYHVGFDINENNNRFLNEDGNNNQRLERVAYWLNELLSGDLADDSLVNEAVDPRVHGATGTGLDEIIEIINNDAELHRRVSNEDIREGARAADGMNAMILEAIQATGVANNGEIGRPDVYAINAYLRATEERYEQWLEYHGDDEGNTETGYHTVQNDGAITRLYDNNALNTVADGLYHLGFEIKNGRILNEDGNANATIEQLSVWLNSLLENDLADGSLVNENVTPYVSGSTGTGLDQLVALIQADEGLNQRLSIQDIRDGAEAADGMNAILVEAIRETGVANDGGLSVGDMHDINAYIQANHYDEWVELHGDDENNEETGFHLVQNDGGFARLFADNAVNTVADGIYHAGFDIRNDRFLNEDGNNNQRLERVAYWLEELLSQDLADGSLANEEVDPHVHGDTGTGLDEIIEIINNDPELHRRVSNEDIREGARAANSMNAMILEAIVSTGVANDGEIGRPDIYAINAYLRADEERYAQWLEHHGDDEGNTETGYHTVQNDGAITRLYDNNALNTVADGLYHLGFEIKNGRVRNEDGNANASVEQLSTWLNSLLADDLADGSLVNDDVTPYVSGGTGTGLDQLVALIQADEGLNQRLPLDEIRDGAEAADGMNAMIVEAIRATGVANDGTLTVGDMYDINAYIQANHYDEWVELHGDDENNEETGFHLVQNDGGFGRLFADNAINTVADGIYHVGFDINENNDRFLNEDGNNNQRLERVAYWLNELLSEDLADGSLANEEVDPHAHGTTGTGLDQLVDIINQDAELNRQVSNEDIREGATAADGMNLIIAEAIQQTGLGNDGEITASDVFDLNAYIREHYLEEWTELHGDDEGNEETGFHTVQNDGATSRLYDQNAVNTVADGLYHMGFEIENGRFLNEDGNANASVEQVAVWLDSLLEDDLAAAAETVAADDADEDPQADLSSAYTDASGQAVDVGDPDITGIQTQQPAQEDEGLV